MMACYELDNEGSITFINRKATELFKMKKEEMIGRNVWDVFPDAKNTLCYDAIQMKALEQRKYAQYEYVSGVFHTLISLSATPTDDGCIVLLHEIENLNTRQANLQNKYQSWLEQQVAERTRALEESKELLQSVFNSAVNIITVYQAVRNEKTEIVDFKYIVCNELAKIYEGSDPAGKLYSDIHQGIKETEILNQFKSVVDTGKTVDFEVYYNTDSTSESWYRFKAVKLGDGLVAAGEDITERKKAEFKINEQNRFIIGVTEAIPDLISVMKLPSRELLYINREPFTLLGFNYDDMLTMTIEEISQLIHPADTQSLLKYYDSLLHMENDGVAVLEYRAKNKKGEWLWLHARGKVFERDTNAQVKSCVNVVHNITAQKKAEQKLKESKDLLQSVFDSANNGFSVLKAVRDNAGLIIDFEYLFANLTTEKINNRYDLIGKSYSAVHSSFKKTGLFNKLKTVVETGETGKMELHYIEENSRPWFSINAVKFGDGVVMSFYDITERKNAEIQHQEQNAMLTNFKRIIDIAHDSIISVDINGNITYWNPASQIVYGYTSGETTGRQLQDFIIPAEKMQELTNVVHTVHGKGKFVTNLITKRLTKDGRILDILLNVFPLKDEAGQIIGSCGIAKDVTGQFAAEKELKKQHNILKQSEELVQSGSWEYNVYTKEFLWSDGMYKIFGIEKGYAVTPAIYFDFVVQEDKHLAEKLVNNVEVNFQAFEETMRIQVRSSIRTLKIKFVPLQNKHGKIEKILGIDLDITANTIAKEKLNVQNQKLSENKKLIRKKDEFMSIASHELKTPLTSISIYMEMLLGKYKKTEDYFLFTSLKTISTQLTRLNDLLNNLLDTTRVDSHRLGFNMQEFDLADLIKETTGIIQPTTSHALILSGVQQGRVHGDRERLNQVFLNLLTNAIKYSPQANKVLIDIQTTANAITVSVQDFGIGIAPEYLDKIFERFYRVEGKVEQTFAGFGIGLYIAAEIMEHHKGTIRAESKKGEGSIFYFTLFTDQQI